MAYAFEEQPEGHGWFGRVHLSWPMLLLAGWVLYEFTAQPGLAALVACAKFGWADVRTAFWLRRVDPDRRRGRTCFWGYLTYGLWKVAVLATVAMVMVGLLSTLLGRGQANNGFSPVLGGATAAAATGFGLSFPLAYVALGSALRTGVRVWLGAAPNRARKERFWPPCHGVTNAAPFVGFTTLILTLWAIAAAAMTLIGILRPNGWTGLMILAGMLAAIVLVMVVLFRLSLRVIARTPQECWAAEEDEAVYQAPGAGEGMSEA